MSWSLRCRKPDRFGTQAVAVFFLFALSVLLAATPAVYAGGGQEADTDEGHDHDEHAGEIPHIEEIPLDAGEKLQVVATTNILGDVVSNIVGDAAELTVLMDVGQNPHSFEPTPRVLRSIEAAHIVYVNGLDLEENLLDEVDSAATSYIVPASAGIKPLDFDDDHDDEDEDHDDEDHDEQHAHSAGDPHVWMDPNNVIVWVENIVETLSEADPRNADRYRRNGEAYRAELVALDEYIREQVASIPESERKLVADHQVFNYFADEYGFEMVGAIVPSTTDTAEPSAREIASLVELIREEDVQAIYVGRTASRGMSRLADSVASEVGRSVAIIPTLTGSLAPRGERGDTYIEFLEYNVEQILSGFSQ